VPALQRYLGVKTLTSGLTGACVYGACALFGVGFPALWGLLAFLLNYVPIIGSIIAAVPAVLLALVEPGLGWSVALPLGLIYLALNNGISNLLEPLLMGQRIGISPFAVLLSLVFWGWLWGPGGMFLAVPLTLVAGVLLEKNHDLRFLAALIGRKPR
jgi:AI-2 transport protein TqsA